MVRWRRYGIFWAFAVLVSSGCTLILDPGDFKFDKEDTGADTDTDTDTDTGTGTGLDTDTGTGSDTDPDTGTDTGGDTETGTDTELDTDKDTEPYTDAGLDAASDTDTGTDTGSASDTDTGTDTDYCDVFRCLLIPPTGQSACYNWVAPWDEVACPGTGGGADCASTAGCGQDAQYDDNQRSFKCRDWQGLERDCSETAVDNDVVEDSQSGLMWQRILPTSYGSTCSNRNDCNRGQAVTYCEELSYGGYEDWRLPDYHELMSIVDYGQYNPAIDTDVFPGTPSTSFWTSSSTVNPVGFAWGINFENGIVGNSHQGLREIVRCVRQADPAGHGERFQVTKLVDRDVVEDLSTGLTWQKEADVTRDWKGALSQCEGLIYGGFDDWRLPNINELASLINTEAYDAASDFPDLPSAWMWSSSSSVGDPYEAWAIQFTNGVVDNIEKTAVHNVICVRDTK